MSVVSPVGELDHTHAAVNAGAGDRYGIVNVGDVEDRYRADIGYGVIYVQSGLAGQLSYPITLQPAVRLLQGRSSCAHRHPLAWALPRIRSLCQRLIHREVRNQHVTFNFADRNWQGETWKLSP